MLLALRGKEEWRFRLAYIFLRRRREVVLQMKMHQDRKMAIVHWYDTKGVHFLNSGTDPIQMYEVTTKRRQEGAVVDVPTCPIQLMYAENMQGVDI